MTKFKPLFFKNKLHIINPYATLGIVTLWSDTDFIIRRLRNAGADLDPESSKIAVVGNLHGQGFRYLLRNLLYNPQIDTLLVLGNDRGGSYCFLSNFFLKGTEPVETSVVYKGPSGNRDDVKPVRVIGTDYVMDNLVSRDNFPAIPDIIRIEGIEKPDSQAAEEAVTLLENYTSEQLTGKRILIEVPEVVVETYPSNLRAHIIVEKTPSKAWTYLVHRVFRFGKRVVLEKGERTELQNVKVVIEKPRFEEESVIKDCGFDPGSFRKYQEEILCPELPSDKTYSYGHRIRAYFGADSLDIVAASLRHGPDDRNCYVSTWDNAADIEGDHRPCLVSLFFRKTDNDLHLTSAFRTHNTSDAWLENVYGLMAIQQYVCGKIGTEPGAITVISHSVSLDPQYLEKVKAIHDRAARTNVIRQDPNGYFLISADGDEIVVRHHHGADKIGEYRSRKPLKIQQMMYRDCAISDINHAILSPHVSLPGFSIHLLKILF